ncbi:MAG: dihydrolipoyl dehydrogenase [Chloroflexi bacterium]|nr:dihydrolipoyl dehydrogenase [Chloroflexota bacterium]
MKEYDVIVIGSGSGMSVVDEALAHEKSVALVDRGPLGGTCPNLGCIPSKMLIFPADRIVEVQDSAKLGISAGVEGVDFSFIMERMRKWVRENQAHMRQGVAGTEGLDFYEGAGHFVSDYTVEVNSEQIRGKQIFIACGSRPLVPPVKGLQDIDYLDNETVLQLDRRPDSLLIIGGGYIAVEYGHFFAAMGTGVTIVELADRLVLSEEPEVAALLKDELSRRMEVMVNTQAQEVSAGGKGVTLTVKDRGSGKERRLNAQRLMVATGRRSNADLLKPENTGVETDQKGFIKVNEYLETRKKNIYAIGDANGQQMFTHVANREAAIAGRNAFHGSRIKMDYSVCPHAIYSHPQAASVGLTEADSRKLGGVLVGRARYMDVAKGEAMMEERGFAKAIASKDGEKILGFHVIGPYAPIIIQEVINAMASGGHINEINNGIHIHPALPELVLRALSNLEEA